MAPQDRELSSRTQELRQLALRLTTDPSLADDLSQDALLAALQAKGGQTTHLPAWFAATLRKNLWRKLRTQDRRRARELLWCQTRRSDEALDVSGLLERREEFERVAAAICRLQTPYRRAIVMRYIEGLTPTQISEREGEPLATIKTRLRRALHALRHRLDPKPALAARGVVASWLRSGVQRLARLKIPAAPTAATLVIALSLALNSGTAAPENVQSSSSSLAAHAGPTPEAGDSPLSETAASAPRSEGPEAETVAAISWGPCGPQRIEITGSYDSSTPIILARVFALLETAEELTPPRALILKIPRTHLPIIP